MINLIVHGMFILAFIVMELLIIRRCLKIINKTEKFNYLNKTTWVLLVTVGNVIGQIMFIYLEYRNKR